MKKKNGIMGSFFSLLVIQCFLITALTSGLALEQAQAKRGVYPTRFRITPIRSNKDGLASTAENLKYYGGPVISNVRVITVFWGPNVNSQIQKDIGSFYTAIVNSTHMDWLSQYGTYRPAVDGRAGTNQSIGRGSYAGEFTITPLNPKKVLGDEEIQAELEFQISQNVLPLADSNSLYMIYFPAGVTISIEGMKSCEAFCAYHEGFNSQVHGNVYYGVMPDLTSGGCQFGCGSSSSVFDSATAVSSHELIEAVTDPFPTPGDKPAYPQAWNTSNGSEIADLCPASATVKSSTRSFVISKEWDNSTKSCKGGVFTSP